MASAILVVALSGGAAGVVLGAAAGATTAGGVAGGGVCAAIDRPKAVKANIDAQAAKIPRCSLSCMMGDLVRRGYHAGSIGWL
jgi:hypothetical protein